MRGAARSAERSGVPVPLGPRDLAPVSPWTGSSGRSAASPPTGHRAARPGVAPPPHTVRQGRPAPRYRSGREARGEKREGPPEGPALAKNPGGLDRPVLRGGARTRARNRHDDEQEEPDETHVGETRLVAVAGDEGCEDQEE